MGLRINTNVAAIATQRNLAKSDREMNDALKQLASGSRLVNASDDAAGLAISENLRGQIGGLKVAGRNAENAQSLIQVAEGGLNEQNNILIRLRELGIQAASDTVSDTEREFLNQEFTQLREEFDRISQTTMFGNKKLLTGSGEQFEFHVGAFAGEENRINYTLDANTSASEIGIDGLDVSDQDGARDSLDAIDQGVEKLAGIRANFGAMQSRLISARSNIDIQVENLSASKSRISDVDVADASAKFVQNKILQDVGIAALTQATALPGRASHLISALY